MPLNPNQSNPRSELERLFNHNDYRHLIEVRAVSLDGQDDSPDKGKMIIEGKAISFNDKITLFKMDGIEYHEIIAKGALDGADITECFLKYNHSDHVMGMARTKNGTLQIFVRDDGVYIRAELANTSGGRDLYELVKRGDIDKMSFSFTIAEEEYDALDHTWTVKKIGKLYDVAAVTVPAYQNTFLTARRLEDAEALRKVEVETSKRVDVEAEKKRMLMLLDLTFYSHSA